MRSLLLLLVLPLVLLADEPTGNLDSSAGQEVLSLLLELHASGTTLVVVTHDEELAQSMQRVVRLHDGRIVADEPTGAAQAG